MHNIITELQSFGVRLALPGHESKGGAGPTEGSAFIVNGVVFSAPVAGHYIKESPYLLQKEGKNYLLLKNNRKIAPIDVVAEPKFYHYKTDDGVPYRKFALLHGKDCLATTVLQNCVHWKKGQQCAFCATEISLSNNSTVKYKTPAQLSQVVRVAYENDNITHIVLTTGTGDPPGSEIAYLAQCTKAIKAKVDIPIQVQCAPPPDLSLIDQLHDAGAEAVGIHVESFDQAILKAVAPAKADIGLAHYEKAWQRAVDLFGPNQVSSFLISGLGETRESILWGSEFLADLGVFPFVVPLRPIPGSKLQDQIPPDPEYMKGIYNAVARIIQKKGLSSKAAKAGCVKCGACSALSVYEDLFANTTARTDPFPEIICHSARTLAEKDKAYQIRKKVFVEEQAIFKNSDTDEYDEDAIHLVAEKKGKIIGTVRIYKASSNEEHWIGGRLAVAMDERHTHAGAFLVKEAMKRVKKRGCRLFTAKIQENNIPFFIKCGWEPIGEVKDHFGLPHLEMKADLDRVEDDSK